MLSEGGMKHPASFCGEGQPLLAPVRHFVHVALGADGMEMLIEEPAV